jgi:L-fuconate dehydratase
LRLKGPKAYSTAGWLGLTDTEILQTIEEVKKEGLDCFKMKVGLDVQQDRERIAFIRGVIGEDSLLMLDANQIWGVDEAISYMKQLVEFRPYWIEEPTARDDVLGYQRIGAALKPYGVGLACGEQSPSPVIFKQLLQQGVIQFCQIDATRLSGVNDVMAVILLAAKYRVPVCPHGGGIGLCNMIQHYAIWDQIAVSGRSDIQVVEYLNFLQEEVFLHPVTISSGAYVLPNVPGWGLEMKDNFVQTHSYPAGKVWQGREASGGVTFLA